MEHKNRGPHPDDSSVSELNTLLQQCAEEVDPASRDEDQDFSEGPSPTELATQRLHYQGLYRTTTGIVRIMRASGNTESADLLEELRQTLEAAQQLLVQLNTLHKRKTGTPFPKIAAIKLPPGQ